MRIGLIPLQKKILTQILNIFLNVYLRNFYYSFPYKKVHINYNKKAWLIKGIKSSCQQKRDLYKIYKITNDLNFRNYYKSYTKILSKVIKAAKKSTL
jgi:hypothetical protein